MQDLGNSKGRNTKKITLINMAILPQAVLKGVTISARGSL